MNWTEFVCRVDHELSNGDLFFDFGPHFVNEQALTRTVALGVRELYAECFDVPKDSDSLRDIVTYRKGDTELDKSTYTNAKMHRWVFFHDVFFAPDILIRRQTDNKLDILPIEVKLVTSKSPSQSIATAIGQSLIYAAKHTQSIVFLGVLLSAHWGKYKLRIPANSQERSFYEKLTTMGVRVIMREVGI